MRKLFALLTTSLVAATAACGVHQDAAPSASGPAEAALSIRLKATPDRLLQDGQQASAIAVQAFNASGQPVAVDVHLDIQPSSFGTLSTTTVRTAATASSPTTVSYIPPAATGGNATTVTILATMITSNSVTSSTQQVSLTVTPATTITGSAPTAVFSVTPPPAATRASTFDASASCAGQLVAGACPSSAGTLTAVAWSFGDNTSGTGSIIGHTYAATGTYVATLTVTNNRGIQASTSQTLVVGAAPAAPTPPTATFTFSPAAPGVGDNIFFNATASTASAGLTITSYAWTFGDGTTGTGLTANHTYATTGAYQVQLKVTDDLGQSTTSQATQVTVGNPPSPTANFSFSASSPGRNDQVVFDASSSSTAQGQTIVDVAWNYGDGTAVVHCGTLFGNDPSCVNPGVTNRVSAHTFTTAQSFVVNLVVTDTAGRIGSHNATVTVVLAEPVVKITTSPGSPNPGTTVSMNSSGTTYFPGSGPGSFLWTFGDGASSALANDTHSYASTGTYTVGLSVTDNKGRTGVSTAQVTVVPVPVVVPPSPPVASFTIASPQPRNVGTVITFDGSGSSGALLTYSWNFGDGNFSNTGPIVTHTYAATGPYSVTLRVTDGSTGLSNTSAAQVVTIVP